MVYYEWCEIVFPPGCLVSHYHLLNSPFFPCQSTVLVLLERNICSFTCKSIWGSLLFLLLLFFLFPIPRQCHVVNFCTFVLSHAVWEAHLPVCCYSSGLFCLAWLFMLLWTFLESPCQYSHTHVVGFWIYMCKTRYIFLIFRASLMSSKKVLYSLWERTCRCSEGRHWLGI